MNGNSIKGKEENPPVLRVDGTYRPLNLELIDRLVKSNEEVCLRDPELFEGLLAIADESHGKVPL